MNPQKVWDDLKMSLTAHCENVKILFDVEFQTSFSHSRITFFKKIGLKKVIKSS